MQDATEFPIRTQWMYDVRSACQTFQCEAWMADRFQFEKALRHLRASIPPALSTQEAEALRELLLIGVTEGARMFHRTYHMMRPRRRCSSSPVEEAHDVWSLGSDDPHKALCAGASSSYAPSTRRTRSRPLNARPPSSASGSSIHPTSMSSP